MQPLCDMRYISSRGPHISRSEESRLWKSYGRRNESPDRHRAAHRNLQVPPVSARAHPVGHHRLQQRPGQPVRVSRLLRLCAAPHPAVSVWTPGVFQLPAQAHLLSHLQGPAGLHQEPGHGEGGQLRPVPLQVRVVGLRGHAAAHRQDGARGAVRVPAVLLPLSRRLLQVAGVAGRRHAAPDASAQVHHHAAGRGHRVPGDGHQPAGRGGLGHDAVLLWLPLHAGPGEAGEVRRPPAVLCHRAAHRDAQAGRELRLPAGAERPPAPAHLGGHAPLHPRGHRHRHHEQRLPGFRHVDRAAVRRERKPGHQRHHLHVLRTLRRRASECKFAGGATGGPISQEPGPLPLSATPLRHGTGLCSGSADGPGVPDGWMSGWMDAFKKQGRNCVVRTS